MTIEFCRAEQVRCAENYECPGARLGLHDWFAEEFLMEEESESRLLAVLKQKG